MIMYVYGPTINCVSVYYCENVYYNVYGMTLVWYYDNINVWFKAFGTMLT